MVKRVGNLMPRIAAIDNLQEAFLRAARGKAGDKAVTAFREQLDSNIMCLHDDLLSGCYRLGSYHFFTVYDPKERVICAASFRDRVAFHAMMRICHPVFDHFQIYDSYASRIGKGTYKALERAETFAYHYKWFAKLDVCKYFDSIHHDVIIEQLCRLFKDKQLLLYFRNIIDSYATKPQRGLPIGNLTSQYFANHYLAVADHYAKEIMQVPAMVRYMDDVLLFDNDKEHLKKLVYEYATFLRGSLKISLHPMVLNNCHKGFSFLGYVVYPSGLRLNGRSKHRFRKKMVNLRNALCEHDIDQSKYAARAQCLFAFVNKADASDFVYKTAMIPGIYPQGL